MVTASSRLAGRSAFAKRGDHLAVPPSGFPQSPPSQTAKDFLPHMVDESSTGSKDGLAPSTSRLEPGALLLSYFEVPGGGFEPPVSRL